jgi:hypothetical protein
MGTCWNCKADVFLKDEEVRCDRCKEFINEKGIKIGYDSWTRIEESPCLYLDKEEIIVKYCDKCHKTFTRDKEFCNECSYKNNVKQFKKGDLKNIALKEKLSDIPTCKNLQNFKQDWTKEEKESGEGEFERET